MIPRLVTWLRPREGWGTFLLLLTTVLCLPAAALDAEWVPRDEGLLSLALFALLVGRWLALRGDWTWPTWLPVSALCGLLAAHTVAAHTVPLLPGSVPAALRFVRRLRLWLDVAVSGGSSDDPDIFLFYAGLLCWGAVFLAAWAFYRRRHPLLALLPLAALSAASIFYSGEGILWLVAELGCGVLLLAVGNLVRARSAWEAAGVDYAADLSLDVVGVAGFVAGIVVLLGTFGPQLSVRQFSTWFWRTFQEPAVRVQETAERLFGGVRSPRRPGGGDAVGASSYMPRSYLLGGRPDLLEDVVMLVWTDEPAPLPEGYSPAPADVPRHYWRGPTFDHYSGRGWTTTEYARQPVDGALPLPAPPAYRVVEQRFEFTAPHGDTLFALNAPVWVVGPVEAVWRGPGDLAGLASAVVSYTVVSRVPTPAAGDLRVSAPTYPPEIVERYLQLPDTLPQRVIDLAREVVAEGETVYGQARLLERYLRAYPYSLDVEQPPEGWDVADYFLFEMREGYCDHYATAFVVMARAVGIPTRMASGYLGGRYDRATGAYQVRQSDGHSWPEVYFPGWGWIGFEPTGARAVSEFPDEVMLPGVELPALPGPPARVVRLRRRWAGVGLAVLLGAAVVGAVWVRRRRQRATQVVTLPLVWRWVGRGGARLGRPPDPALTPREYASVLAAELRAHAGQTRRWSARWMALATEGGAALAHLATLYNTQLYAGPQAAPVGQTAARAVWARLHSPLRWFGWLAWVHRIRAMNRRLRTGQG